MTDHDLRAAFPWIAWDEPLRVDRSDSVTRFACRLCVARHGLKGMHISDLPRSREEALAHILRAHPHTGGHQSVERRDNG
jgi:hypothetical protein